MLWPGSIVGPYPVYITRSSFELQSHFEPPSSKLVPSMPTVTSSISFAQSKESGAHGWFVEISKTTLMDNPLGLNSAFTALISGIGVGYGVGGIDGLKVGRLVGSLLGKFVGSLVGGRYPALVGDSVGNLVGLSVGMVVGGSVHAIVLTFWSGSTSSTVRFDNSASNSKDNTSSMISGIDSKLDVRSSASSIVSP